MKKNTTPAILLPQEPPVPQQQTDYEKTLDSVMAHVAVVKKAAVDVGGMKNLRALVARLMDE